MNVQELGEEYRNKTDKELLRLALSPDQLTSEAQLALTTELASRGIGGEASREAARREEEERKAENDRELGTLGFVLPGVGRMRFGKANRSYDPETDIERFKTTIFIVLLCFHSYQPAHISLSGSVLWQMADEYKDCLSIGNRF